MDAKRYHLQQMSGSFNWARDRFIKLPNTYLVCTQFLTHRILTYSPSQRPDIHFSTQLCPTPHPEHAGILTVLAMQDETKR